MSQSSTEVKYRAVALTAAELRWLDYLLREPGIFLPSIPLLYCDNLSTIHRVANPIFHAQTHHIEIDYNFLRELSVRQSIAFRYVPTNDQIAGMFTKSISSDQFSYLISKQLPLSTESCHVRQRNRTNHGVCN